MGALLAAIGTGVSSSGLGQTDSDLFFDDLPIVLTASRMAQSPLDAPAPVTVIDREAIDASGFTEIHDILRLAPGFLVADWPDGSPTIANHGVGDAYGRRIKVLVDGRTINNPLWGNVNWQDMPLRVDDIERIEVVRGPNGAAYGANAFQGVVNIITRATASESGAALIARVGEPNIRDVGVRLNSRGGTPLDWRITASRRTADNFDSYNEQSSESIVRKVLNSQFSAHLSPQDLIRLQFGVTAGVDRRGYPPATANNYPIRSEKLDESYLHVAWIRSFDAESEFSLQYYHQGRSVRGDWLAGKGNDPLVPANGDIDTTRDDLELQLTRRFNPQWHVLVGAGVRRDTAESERYFSTGRTIVARQWQTFGSVTWQPVQALSINAGGTFERHDYSGSLFSPRLAFNFALTENSALRLSTGIAYRAPSFMESDSFETLQNDGKILGIFYRAGLKVEPEKVRYSEIGYLARFPALGLNVDTRYFHERYSRYLDDQTCSYTSSRRACRVPPPENFANPPRSDRNFMFLNSGAFVMHGLELGVDWKVAGIGRALLSQAFVKIREDGYVPDASLVDSAPASLTSLLLIKELPQRWRFSLGYYHNSEMSWLNDGGKVPARDRFDIKLAKGFGATGSEDEFSITAQSLGGAYPEFHEESFRHEPRIFASLRLGW
ncbi:TonB-dependent receptor plug domain-containing protein [Azoarcus indigens]|nr:TonB-dependent receptor [Azoarcus indigens]